MTTIEGVAAIREWRDGQSESKTIGLVPTMGALHEGHLSLVRCARADCDVVAVSVFVNPTQFGPGEDLDRYPRDPEADATLADAAGADLIWFAARDEVYPPQFATRVELPRLADRLCGLARPVHFGGVALIVLKLFHLFRPHRAYFGEKDYQQSVLVRRMGRDLDLGVQVIACPTVREESGLACSSRNQNLTERGRTIAGALARALLLARDRFRAGERDGAALVLVAARELVDPALTLEYLELVDPETLEPVERVDPTRGARLLVAATVERVRLIDNVQIGGEGE